MTGRSGDDGRWHAAGHEAVCLALGCGWREPSATPRHAEARAFRHGTETGHRVGVERKARRLVKEGITDAR